MLPFGSSTAVPLGASTERPTRLDAWRAWLETSESASSVKDLCRSSIPETPIAAGSVVSYANGLRANNRVGEAADQYEVALDLLEPEGREFTAGAVRLLAKITECRAWAGDPEAAVENERGDPHDELEYPEQAEEEQGH